MSLKTITNHIIVIILAIGLSPDCGTSLIRDNDVEPSNQPNIEAPLKLELFAFSKPKFSGPIERQQRASDAVTLITAAASKLNLATINSIQEHVMSVEQFLRNPVDIRVSKEIILDNLKSYAQKSMDTLVIYSHTHGVRRNIVDSKPLGGLMLGDSTGKATLEGIADWSEYGEALLSISAKNVIVFTMACFSGGLIDYLNNNKNLWQDRKNQERNFLVISAQNSELESKPVSINGQIINPFTYSVEKALNGEADGYLDSKPDGKTTYNEVINFIIDTTRKVGTQGNNADPQFTGSYNPNQVFIQKEVDSNSEGNNNIDTSSDNNTDTSLDNNINQIAQNYIDESGNSIHSFPGISITYITPEKVGFVGAGTTQMNQSIKPTAQTVFPLGSITKLWTGLILADAVTKEEISLNSSAKNYLQDYNIDNRITLKQLVTHTSGLPRQPQNIYPNRPNFIYWAPARDYSTTELRNCLRTNGCRPQTNPGNSANYSNLGFALLGMVIQNHYGTSNYTELINKTIGPRLGLKSTGSNTPNFLSKAVNTITKGYHGLNQNYPKLHEVPPPDMGINEGAGEMLSNSEDMAQLLKALVNNQNSNLTATIEEFHKTLFSNSTITLGYGVKIKQKGDEKVYSKSGITYSSSSYIVWSPKKRTGVVVLTNRGDPKDNNYERKLIELSEQIFNLLN